MTQQVRVNFLNWQPDKEPISYEGLTRAENVLHDTSGYKALLLQTTSSASTMPGIVFTADTLISVKARQLGSLQDASPNNKLHVWMQNNATFASLRVALLDVTGTLRAEATLTAAGGTLMPLATAGAITAFEACELEGYVFVCAEARGDSTFATEISANITAYLPITT